MAFEPIINVKLTGGGGIDTNLFDDIIRGVNGPPDLEPAKEYQEFRTDQGVHVLLVRVLPSAFFEFNLWDLPDGLYAGVDNTGCVTTVKYERATVGGRATHDVTQSITGEFMSPTSDGDVTPYGENSFRVRQRIRASTIKNAAGQILEYMNSTDNVYAAGAFANVDAAVAANKIFRVDTQAIAG